MRAGGTIDGGAPRVTGARPRRVGRRVVPLLLLPVLLFAAAPGAGAVPLPIVGRQVPAAHVHHSRVAPFTLANVEVYPSGASVPGITKTSSGLSGTYDPATGTLQVGWGNPSSLPDQGSLDISGQGSLAAGSGVTGGIQVEDGGQVCSSDRGAAAAVIDQFQVSGSGSVTSLAIQFGCALTDGTLQISGTVALDIVPSTPGAGYYLYGQSGAIGGFGNDSYLSYLGDLSATPLNQSVVGMAQTPDGGGYWLTAADGGVFAYGDAGFYGSTGSLTLNKPIVGMASTPDGRGYWFVASDGGIFAFGDAGFYGSTGSLTLNKPIVGMASTPDGRGYWLVASDGGIFAFGDAGFYGSTGSLTLNKPIVGMASTPDGRGYWLVASDGGIFAFGDAGFYGSTGSLTLNKPIVGMASTPDGRGYWLVASDGGIFAFGDAGFYGSTGSLTLNKPIEGMAATPDGRGYWMVASDGGIFAFGDAPFEGSLGGQGITGIAGISPG